MKNTRSLSGNEYNQMSRRSLLKGLFAGLTAGFVASFLPVRTAYAAEQGKNLVVYFSYSGNTRVVATQIHSLVGGDILELKTAHSYPEEYRPCTEQAKREQEQRFRPTLTTDIDPAPYDNIFIGYPMWWGTMPMALFSFLEKHDFSGKTMIPFCTHGGTGLGRGPQDIARACPKAKILKGLAIVGTRATSSQKEIEQWLRQLGMIA